MIEADSFFEQLKDRITAGDERGALDDLRQLTKERAPRLYNETILQVGRLNQLEASERRGELTREEFRVETAKLRRSFVSLVDAADRVMRSGALPTRRADVVFSRTPEETTLEKIIGANNLKSIAWLRRGLDVARSVCRVVTPRTIGSGFLLSGCRLMTNHHVIPSAEIAAKSYVEFNVEEDLEGRLSPPYRVTIDADTVRAEEDLDFCLATLKEPALGVPLSEWGFLEIDTVNVPAVGEHVTIIQHPAGGPKQIAITANQVVNIYEHRLQYSTDTMPGSSGSPVFNDNWRVVALHHRGGNLVTNASGDRMYANEGILVRDLKRRLSL